MLTIRRTFRSPARLAALLIVAGCATNPVTGKRELSLVSQAQEIDMGRQSAGDVDKSIGLVENPALQAYVTRIGLSLAAKTERPTLPWQFHVVDDPVVNAFALPGGFIFVTRGLLTHLTNEAELATVLGHESGHVAARHSVQQMSRAQVAQLGLGIGMVLSPAIAKFGDLASTGLGLMFLKFSRSDESQADEIGFRYALADGYDVRQMVGVFQMLDQETKLSGGGRLPEWQSTHPDPGNRITATQTRLAAVKEDLSTRRVGGDDFLQQTDGMVYGENPRQGFFQGTLFLHPDLKFRVQFPDGWKTQNSSDAVMAASAPQDAVIQLRVAYGTAAEASQKFFAQQGLQATNVTRVTVQGLPAVTGDFVVTSDQGSIRGLASFIEYNGSTYRLLGYTASATFTTYAAAFQRSLGSFARLTDPAALAVQPMRIKLERAARVMTLEQFNAQLPSAIPIDELALINGMEKTAQLRVGQFVKCVVK
jgi:predicted Zn-dependent protease